MINYNGKKFRSITSTNNGEVSEATVFHYFQKNNIVWAEYSGGSILSGHLIATVNDVGHLDMRYHHINSKHELMTGICVSKPLILDNGMIRLYEEWEWTCNDYSKGKSIVEQFEG